MNKYSHKSNLLQGWIWVTYIPILFIVCIQFLSSENRVNFTTANFYIEFIIILLPLTLLTSMKVEFELDSKTIKYRFFPFHIKFKEISWSEVLLAQIVEFNPIKHYLGFGYRKSKKYGTALIYKGNIGLLLKLKNDNRPVTIEINDLQKFNDFVQQNNLQVNTEKIPIDSVLLL